MFTGIIQKCGIVASVEANEFGVVLRIDPGGWVHVPAPGDSIAVNGCCLTATTDPEGAFRFDVIRQTLQMTTLGGLTPGDPVNLEHAVTPSTMLGGHIVQGHVDGVGEVTRVDRDPEEMRVRIAPPAELMPCIIDKGSIAIDGVSLTIATLEESWLEIALIPTTIDLTILGRVESGDHVNIETDYVAKTVVSWLERQRNPGA